MANSPEADICNVALARVGVRQFITSLDPAVDAEEFAALCAVLYPAVRNNLLARFPWGFASREQVLQAAALGPTDPKVLPGYAHVYLDPSDILTAQAIFAGVRPGASVVPMSSGDADWDSPEAMQFPAMMGRARRVVFKRAGGYVFTDWADSPSAWSSTTTYSLHAIVTNANGTYSRSLQDGNTNHATTDGAWWVTVTDPASAVLTYTALVTDATLFPPLWTDALRWALALELALTLPKPDLAEGMEKKFQSALSTAMAAEGNGQEPEVRPDSDFILVRG